MDIRDTADQLNRHLVKDTEKMTITIPESKEIDDELIDTVFPAKYEVCDVCEGKGHYVNPNIDRHGLSSEDFDEDPDFRDQYISGIYDIQCRNCKGKGMELVIDGDRTSAEDLNLWKDYMESFYRDMEESRQEARVFVGY